MQPALPTACPSGSALVYLDAFVPRDGQSILDLLPPAFRASRSTVPGAASGDEDGLPGKISGDHSATASRIAISASGAVTCGLWLASISCKRQPGSDRARSANWPKRSSGEIRVQ